MKFSLLGKKIEISEGRKNYMKILSDFEDIADKAKLDFKKDYESTFGLSFFSSSFAEKFSNKYFDDKMTEFVLKYVKETKKYISKYGVYTLTDDEIWNSISEERNGISCLQETMENFIVDYCSDCDDYDAVRKIKRNFESGYFESALNNDIMSLCDFTINYISKNNLAEIQFVYQKDASKAKAIYENLKDDIVTDEKAVEIMMSIPTGLTDEEFSAEYEKRSGSRIDTTDKLNLAFELIELDPRKKEYYTYIFKHLPRAKYEIVAIAKYLNIDLSVYIEEDLKTTFDFKKISNEEAALKMMDKINVSMKKYGVSDSLTKKELEKILHAYDIEARTYDGVLYETRPLCEQAKKDDIVLKNLYGNISILKKDDCKKFMAEIKNTSCTENIKAKHINFLQERVFEIDRKYFQKLLSGIKTYSEEECNNIRNEIKSYDTTDDIKSPFLSQLDKRIYEIWDAEDFEKFAEIFKQIQVGEVTEIQETSKMFLKIGRTETKELFSKAVYLLVLKENVEAAAKYAVAKEGGLLSSIINIGKKSTYETLTFNGRIMHPALLNAIEEVKVKKNNGIFSGFVFKKNKNQKVESNNTKFCPNCGVKTSIDAKFCSNCGSKI